MKIVSHTLLSAISAVPGESVVVCFQYLREAHRMPSSSNTTRKTIRKEFMVLKIRENGTI